MLDKDFLRAMVENMAAGIKNGREPGDWKEKELDEVADRFNAISRHCEKYIRTGDRKHLAAIACNAMMVWWFDKEGKI